MHSNLIDNKGSSLSITFVYGHPNLSKREVMWQQLRNLRSIAQPNWLCIDDFNRILACQEKLSFHEGPVLGAQLLQQVVNELHLCDLRATEQRFTWMNNREENDFIMEILDGAFANIDWVNNYPNYGLRNFPIYHSDHGPII